MGQFRVGTVVSHEHQRGVVEENQGPVRIGRQDLIHLAMLGDGVLDVPSGEHPGPDPPDLHHVAQVGVVVEVGRASVDEDLHCRAEAVHEVPTEVERVVHVPLRALAGQKARGAHRISTPDQFSPRASRSPEPGALAVQPQRSQGEPGQQRDRQTTVESRDDTLPTLSPRDA